MLISATGRPAFEPAGIETPALVVSEQQLRQNIARLQAIADAAGCTLRPHIKTHKSVQIGAMQVAAGARGITAAKTDEALVFIRAGFGSVTVATPILAPAKIERLLAAREQFGTDLNFIAETAEAAGLVASRAEARGVPVGMFMKVDVGLGRVGVQPRDAGAVAVAREISLARGLRFRGLLSHAGHAYGAGHPEGVAAVAERERSDMLALADRLRRAGIEVPVVSVGSTPTVLGARSLEGITELRPGNGIFLDLNATRLGLCGVSDLALGVVATVLSVGSRYAIIDAGSKVLSSDLGAHGMASDAGYGRAFPFGRESGGGFAVERLSEEHGFLPAEAGLKSGEPVLVLPNHACPLPNLVGVMTLLGPDGSRREIRAEAASCVR